MMHNILFLLLTAALALTACSKNGFNVAQVDLSSTEGGAGGPGGDDPGSTTTTTLPWSQRLGTFDSNCQNNPNYDACIFWKNPLAKQNAALSDYLDFGDDLSERQTYGVKLQDQIDPLRLESASIKVYTSNFTGPPGFLLPATGPAWKLPYSQDVDTHWNVQVMTYFWLTVMEKRLLSRTGIYYAKGKAIPVNAFNKNIINNAMWNGREIVVGAANEGGSNRTPRHELGLSVEVVLHEMGHANLSYGGGRGLGGTCANKLGCAGAMNEGQADFHYVLIFPESTALAETSINNLAGWSWQGISRDVRQNAGKKAADFYAASNGEIHAMGSLYASVLWDIYSDPRVDRAEFEKIFLLHLQKITDSSNFLNGRDMLLAEDLALFGGKYRDIITEVFARREF